MNKLLNSSLNGIIKNNVIASSRIGFDSLQTQLIKIKSGRFLQIKLCFIFSLHFSQVFVFSDMNKL